jgi:hypothetical protein
VVQEQADDGEKIADWELLKILEKQFTTLISRPETPE